MRVNLSHGHGDTALNDVLDVIDGEDRIEDATGATSAATVLNAKLSVTDTGTVLDLLSHARKGVLLMAHWNVGSKAKAQQLYTALGSLAGTIAKIRLLGCNTGYMKDGKACMKMLRDVFKTATIYGSRVPVGTTDFNSEGFVKDSYLDDHTKVQAAAPAPASDAVVMGWHERFPAYEHHDLRNVLEHLERATLEGTFDDWSLTIPEYRWPVRQTTDWGAFESFVTLCSPVMVVARGLLAMPEREVIVAIGGPFGVPLYHRLTLLLDGCFLRIYPRGHRDGVILRVPEASRARIDALFKQCRPVSLSTFRFFRAPVTP